MTARPKRLPIELPHSLPREGGRGGAHVVVALGARRAREEAVALRQLSCSATTLSPNAQPQTLRAHAQLQPPPAPRNLHQATAGV